MKIEIKQKCAVVYLKCKGKKFPTILYVDKIGLYKQ